MRYDPRVSRARTRSPLSAASALALCLLALATLPACPAPGDAPPAASAPPEAPAANNPPDAGSVLVASKNGEVYHLPGCKWAQEIAAQNRVEYTTPGKARADGKRRCKECSPP